MNNKINLKALERTMHDLKGQEDVEGEELAMKCTWL